MGGAHVHTEQRTLGRGDGARAAGRHLLLVSGRAHPPRRRRGAITLFGAPTSGLFPHRWHRRGPRTATCTSRTPTPSSRRPPRHRRDHAGRGHHLPHHVDIDGPADVTIGGDGNLWFTDTTAGPPGQQTGRIGRLNLTTGAFTFFSPGSASSLQDRHRAGRQHLVHRRRQRGAADAHWRHGHRWALSVTAATGGTTGDIARRPDGNMDHQEQRPPQLLQVNPRRGTRGPSPSPGQRRPASDHRPRRQPLVHPHGLRPTGRHALRDR